MVLLTAILLTNSRQGQQEWSLKRLIRPILKIGSLKQEQFRERVWEIVLIQKEKSQYPIKEYNNRLKTRTMRFSGTTAIKIYLSLMKTIQAWSLTIKK